LKQPNTSEQPEQENAHETSAQDDEMKQEDNPAHLATCLLFIKM